MAITRRSFLAGLGSVSVGLLFWRKRSLESLEHELIDEPQTEGQQPSAAIITAQPQWAFSPRRLIVSIASAPFFEIDDIQIGNVSQLVESGPIPAAVFSTAFLLPSTALSFDTAAPGAEVRFRVRYVGNDPKGVRFQAALIGTVGDASSRFILPIDSIISITA